MMAGKPGTSKMTVENAQWILNKPEVKAGILKATEQGPYGVYGLPFPGGVNLSINKNTTAEELANLYNKIAGWQSGWERVLEALKRPFAKPLSKEQKYPEKGKEFEEKSTGRIYDLTTPGSVEYQDNDSKKADK